MDYRDNLQINTKYERPLMAPYKEWKELMDYAKEKELIIHIPHIIFSMKNFQYFFLLLNIFKLRYLTYLKPFIGSPTPIKR